MNDNLPKSELTLNVVCFEEGNTIEDLILEAMRDSYFLVLLIDLAIRFKIALFDNLGLSFKRFLIGYFLSERFYLLHDSLYACYINTQHKRRIKDNLS